MKLDEEAARKLEEDFDPEIRFRPIAPPASWLVAGLLFGLSCFHYYTAGFGLLREVTHRGIHMSLVLSLVFLVFPLLRRDSKQLRPSSVIAPGGVPLTDWAMALAIIKEVIPLLG